MNWNLFWIVVFAISLALFLGVVGFVGFSIYKKKRRGEKTPLMSDLEQGPSSPSEDNLGNDDPVKVESDPTVEEVKNATDESPEAKAEESAPDEAPSPDEAKAEEALPADEAKAEESAQDEAPPAEESAPEEAPPADEAKAEESTPEEAPREVAVDEAPPADEAKAPEDSNPAEVAEESKVPQSPEELVAPTPQQNDAPAVPSPVPATPALMPQGEVVPRSEPEL
ncbi:MAG: uncharacterized protein KVP18_003269 [Porospora cf. gigantea A]|uniref:uncharacterized protein n=1 Tax=Porospora cf. gigantea A TaxID=2853593 RepID=UPI003559C2DB|nr:MAG: hypothetical protein KVP18_003269 [Porospora cf. gigantea A]